MKAFPNVTGEKGMDLRDYFAAKIMQGFAFDSNWVSGAAAAERAYRWADAMMEAREQNVNKRDEKISRKTGSRKRKKPFSHVACYSYPNCDEAPNGCFEQTAPEDIEEYGFKD